MTVVKWTDYTVLSQRLVKGNKLETKHSHFLGGRCCRDNAAGRGQQHPMDVQCGEGHYQGRHWHVKVSRRRAWAGLFASWAQSYICPKDIEDWDSCNNPPNRHRAHKDACSCSLVAQCGQQLLQANVSNPRIPCSEDSQETDYSQSLRLHT